MLTGFVRDRSSKSYSYALHAAQTQRTYFRPHSFLDNLSGGFPIVDTAQPRPGSRARGGREARMRTDSHKEKAQHNSHLCERLAKSHGRSCVVPIAALWRRTETSNNVKKEYPKEMDCSEGPARVTLQVEADMARRK